VPAEIFPKLPEEGSPLLFRAKGGRRTLILNYLGKGKERLRIGEKRVSSLNTRGIIGHIALQVNPVQGQYWSTRSEW
jgi:hypothetical protein